MASTERHRSVYQKLKKSKQWFVSLNEVRSTMYSSKLHIGPVYSVAVSLTMADIRVYCYFRTRFVLLKNNEKQKKKYK